MLTEAMAIAMPDLGEYRDRYADRLLEAIEKKVARQKIVESSPVASAGESVISLMAALEASLEQTKGRPRGGAKLRRRD